MFHSNRGRRRRGVNYSIRRHIHGSLGFTLPLLVAVAALIGLLTATAPAASQDPGARRVGRSLAAGMVQSPVRETQTTLAIESPPTTQATPATGTTVATQTTLAAQTTLPTHLPDRLPIVPPDAMVRLALDPVEASTIPNNPQAFTARVSIVIGPHQEPTAKNPDTFRVGLDVTPFTQFTIEDGSCSRSRVAANCLAASRGTHIVTGTLPANAIPGVPYRLRGQARLQVEPPPDQLLLEPLRATIELGTGQTYTAQGVADGELLPGELTEQARFTFTGRDGTHECQQSTCTPTALGDYSVIGTLVSNPGVRGKALLHVVPPVRLRLEPNPASIELGKSQAYTAQHVAGAGSRLDDVTGQTTFTMTGPDGKTQECPEATCTPAARGDYVVTGTLVSNPDVRGTAMLHVHRPPGRLRLDPRSATIRLGERQRYTAQRAAEDGSWRDVTGQTTFTMTGSDGTHACRGNICTPAVSGDYTVRGSLFDNPDVRGTALLHVPQPPVGLQLEPGEATIELGREQRYTAQGVAANGSLLDDLTGHTSFTMTGPDGTHECRGSTCKPAMRGDYTVTGTLVDDPKVRGTAVLHVHPPRPSRLQLDPSKATIVLGVSQDYTARGIAANGDPLDDVTGQTRFTLTGPDGIHDCQQSTCTPAAAGDYTVTGSLKDDSRVRGTAVLHVLPPLDHLLLRPERATIPLGQSQYYTARGVATDDSLLEDLTDQTTFTLTGPDGTHQ